MRTFQRIARLIRPAVALPTLAALALAGMVVLGLGCGGPERRENPPPHLMRDVPVPAGFQFVPKESTDRSTAGVRLISHLYKGQAPVRETADFYARAMPARGWTLRDRTFNRGKERLVFEKGRETAYVTLWDDWGAKLMVQVYPQGMGPTKHVHESDQ